MVAVHRYKKVVFVDCLSKEVIMEIPFTAGIRRLYLTGDFMFVRDNNKNWHAMD